MGLGKGANFGRLFTVFFLTKNTETVIKKEPLLTGQNKATDFRYNAFFQAANKQQYLHRTNEEVDATNGSATQI